MNKNFKGFITSTAGKVTQFLITTGVGEGVEPDVDGFVELVRNWVNPILTASLILLPLIAAGWMGFKGIKWFSGTDSEQEEMQLGAKFKKGFIILIFIESIVGILRLLGMTV